MNKHLFNKSTFFKYNILANMEKLKSICVFCGSSRGHDPAFRTAALQLSDFLVQQECRLVNGGGSIGLMGVMADRVLEMGGDAIGVIPLGLKEREVAHLGMTELIVVPDMHARKLKMVNLSDAFIALPGGFGTMDELFETLTWSQLHLHNKPIGLLNVNGFYDPLIALARQMEAQGFLRSEALSLLHVDDDIPTLFQKLQMQRGSSQKKWEVGPVS
jgi:uncharacterized protein (TIGR00730 family)